MIKLLPLLGTLFFASASDVLYNLEQRLDTRFSESVYQRYLYYCRQQEEGERLAEHSRTWLRDNPDEEILRFGRGEGLLMAGEEKKGLDYFRELYEDSPGWGNQIIFTLKELDNQEMVWYVEMERERTGNPTLHARLMVEHYLAESRERKALDELAGAVSAGADPGVFKRYTEALSRELGKDKILDALGKTSPRLRFQMALEVGDKAEVGKTIEDTGDSTTLLMMGRMCEEKGYLDQALTAFQKAGSDADAARVLVLTDKKDQARNILEGNKSRRGREELAFLLSSSVDSYGEAIEVLEGLERDYGNQPEWTVPKAALMFLCGNGKEARQELAGIGLDSSVVFLKGILAASQGNVDSMKRLVDISLLRFPGNSYENDLLLLYGIVLTKTGEMKRYARALAAYHWGDANKAYREAETLAEENPELADEALLLAAESLVKLGRYQEASERYQRLADEYHQSPLSPRARFEQALLLRDKLGRQEKAKGMLKNLILKEPTSLYADLARKEL